MLVSIRYARNLTLRFRISDVLSRAVQPNETGIFCVAVPSTQFRPELVLIVDEPDNEGASVTNSIETVLQYLHGAWGPLVDWESCDILVQDSMGYFDFVVHSVENDKVVFKNWKPVAAVKGRPARSLDAALLTVGAPLSSALSVFDERR